MRRLLSSPTARTWALNLVLAAAAAGLCRALAGLPASAHSPRVPWWALVALFALAEVCVVHIHFRRSAHSFTLAEIPLVVGLTFMAPLPVVLAWVAGAGLVLALVVRLRPARLAFNLALFALAGATTALVMHASAGPAWTAAVAGVLAGSATSVALIALAMALTGERFSVRRLAGMIAMASPIAAANASLGLAVAALLAIDAWQALTLLPVAGALLVAYRALTAERAKHTSLEFIHAAGQTLARAADPALGLAGVLAMALDGFRAESAEAFLLDGAGSRVAIGADQRVETHGVSDEALLAELRALAVRDTRARLVTPEQAGPALAGHLRRHGIERAMLAVLSGDERSHGVLLIANRLGLGAFGRSDLKLFETLAHHIGSSLGQDRLGRQVRELHVLRDELEHRAFHDPLTGLANRLLFHDRVRHALTRRDGSVALIYVDLDDFKQVNDTLGHEAGDVLLQAVAERLDESLRAEDTPARLGGDEFAVILLDVQEEQARVVADRILRALGRPVQVPGAELAIHASLGVAIAASGSMDADELIRHADVAMYVSKHGGKRGYSVYDSTMEAS